MTEDSYGNPISVKLKFDYELGETVFPEAFAIQALAEPNIAMADFLKDCVFLFSELYNQVLERRESINFPNQVN